MLGREVRNARRDRALSQRAVAEALSCAHTSIWRFEHALSPGRA